MAARARSPSLIIIINIMVVAALCLLLVIVPRVSALFDIPLCSNTTTTTTDDHVDYYTGYGTFFTGVWSANAGTTDRVCMANSVTGLSSLSSFSYAVAVFAAGTAGIQAAAIVINAEADNAVVASVDISALLPTTASQGYQNVNASFPSAVTLDPLVSYRLAFCLAAGNTGDRGYLFGRITSPADSNQSSIQCTNTNPAECMAAAGVWLRSTTAFRVLIMKLIGEAAPCPPSPSPSPSSSASPSPSASLSPSAATTPSASPSRAVCCVGPSCVQR
jgi:hypothetical protein